VRAHCSCIPPDARRQTPETPDANRERAGVDLSIANELRRILLADVPTVAIDHVFVFENTSILQDDVLVHRLGLLPVRMDPSLLEYRQRGAAATERNTVVFELDVECEHEYETKEDGSIQPKRDDDSLKKRVRVMSENLLRVGRGGGDRGGRGCASMAHDDITIAVLRPGQRIHLEAHCTKGTGNDNAKWSPVATAWYRLLPEITVGNFCVDADVASLLVGRLPGLFSTDFRGRLVAGDARKHERDLERLRALLCHPNVAACVQLTKRTDHIIFTLESTGAVPPIDLFIQALDILYDRACGVVVA
jgi:DNA-directed RNA polymerase I and III subunit RPAC1